MMNIALIIGFVIVVLTIGHVVLRRKYNKLCADKKFAEEYREWFYRLQKKYFSTYNRLDRAGKLDSKAYSWLTMNVDKMQFMLGRFGLANYKSAYQANYLRDYKVLANTLPKFRNNSIHEDDASLVDDCLLRYSGYLDKGIEIFRSKYLNPIECAKYGLRRIMSVPIELLGWFGVFSDAKVKQFLGGQFFKGVNGLVGLAGAVVAIVEFWKLFAGFFAE